jgi:putative ABC transport system permease protein
MRFSDLITSALKSLATHKGRSAFTVLGIVIGITSIIVIMSVGSGAKSLVLQEVQSFGPNTIFVLPGRQPSGFMDFGGTLMSDSLKNKDFEDLAKKENVPDAVRVVPYVFGPATAVYESDTYDTTVIGSTPGVADSFSLTVQEGRFFDDSDVSDHARVAVIGPKIADELFGAQDPIGEKIRVNNVPFRIIGLLEAKGRGSFIDFDKAVMAPYTAVQSDVLGIHHIQRISIEASSAATIKNVVHDATLLLRDNHNIDDPKKDDFFIQTQEDIAKSIGTITTILSVLLASVAAISLIVGGVGIMNVMFVSVTERTREIGLRKALGATARAILSQFLIEAVFLTVGGGIVGVVAGGALTFAATYVVNAVAGLSFPFAISVPGVLWGVGVSAAIGLVFGLFPARSAARKSPIEALRYD